MYRGLSDHNLIIPEQYRQKLLTELDEFIGSNRLKSRIVSLKQLMDVLWKRNAFQTEEGERVGTIFSRYPAQFLDYYRKYLTSNGELVNFSINFHCIVHMRYLNLILRTNIKVIRFILFCIPKA